MKKFTLMALAGFLFLTGHTISDLKAGAPEAKSVIRATRHCEAAVKEHCRKPGGVCEQYCEKAGGTETWKKRCKANCKNSDECDIRLSGGYTKQGSPLQAQINEMGVQCIAEHRDPLAVKSGRRIFASEKDGKQMGWKDVVTPSFGKPTGQTSGPQISKAEWHRHNGR